MSSPAKPPAPEEHRAKVVGANGHERGANGRVREGAQVLEMQRRRLLTAAVEVVFEHGAHALTAALVSERARMSRRTLYDIFEGCEPCLLAAFEDSVRQAGQVVARATSGEHRWRGRVRAGLTALLSFLDREPAMGRLLIVEALGAGARIQDARRDALAQAAAIVDRGRAEARTGRQPLPLTAEGVVGAVFSVVHARMLEHRGPPLEHRGPPLVELAGPLMAMIVQPYLGLAAAQRELERPIAIERAPTPRLPTDPFKDLPIRLTYRTVRVLSSIAAAPGASSKQVAEAAGITDEGQTSKLLSRLRRHDLIRDAGIGPAKGLPRAWTLTARGEGVLQAVGQG